MQNKERLSMAKVGRKTIDEEKRDINVTIRFTATEIKEFEKLGKEINVPKTRLIRNLALSQLDDIKIMKKVGIWTIAQGVLSTSEWIKAFKEQRNKASAFT
jgi:hypothetical protein